MPDYDLDRAYELKDKDEVQDLYGNWAETYDNSFGEGWGFVAPREIAKLYLKNSNGDEPILDIGAGTGLVTEHLEGAVTDAFDITPKMLEKAATKNIYRNLIEGDLLATLPFEDGTYGGVISCGTFTHGHVGPECLPELLRVTKPGGLFVCGTIPSFLDKSGFGSALALLVARAQITPVAFTDIQIYDNPDHPHSADRGLVMVFRKI
ncbi:MAG: class I SAM-dependent methyltransferase [Pseudomonadota bacterium]